MGGEAPQSETERPHSGLGPSGDSMPGPDVSAPPSASVWGRIRDHKVVQWTLAYAAAAYTLLHAVEMVSGALDWPHLVVRIVTLLLILGVPIAATLAWYHGHRARHRVSGPELAILTILLLIAGSVLWLVGRPSHEQAQKTAGSDAPASAVALSPAQGTIPEKSVAVLPFINMSSDKEQEYFSDGLAEELIDLLAKVQDLRVPARTSSFYFKGKAEKIDAIAKELRVAHVLEGSVRKAGNTIRVTAQLIRVDSGYHLWSETYDRDIKDVFNVQHEIAAAVVEALKAKLAPTQQASTHRTSSAEAYNQLLLGRQFYNRGSLDGFRRAVEADRKAIALDPNYAAALAGLAVSEYWIAALTGDVAGYTRAEQAADTAVARAPDEADSYSARGYLRGVYRRDWAGAQADLAKALALDPADSTVQRRYAVLLTSLGRLPEAIAVNRKAIDLDPLSSLAWGNLGRNLTASGEFAAAHEALRRAREIEPENASSLNSLGMLQLLEGKTAEALATYRTLKSENYRLAGIAMAEHTLGHAKESRQALDEVVEKHAQDAAYEIAEAYAWLGEKDKAFESLARAHQQRNAGLVEFKIDPLLASLRGDPRYKALLGKLNLPE